MVTITATMMLFHYGCYMNVQFDLHSDYYLYCGTWKLREGTIMVDNKKIIPKLTEAMPSTVFMITHYSVSGLITTGDIMEKYTIEMRRWIKKEIDINGYHHNQIFIGYDVDRGRRCIIFLGDNSKKRGEIDLSIIYYDNYSDIMKMKKVPHIQVKLTK